MATAAQNAMPGEALYPIKRGIEKAEAGLSLGSAARGRDLLHQATGRLGEAEGLVGRDPSTATLQVAGHDLDVHRPGHPRLRPADGGLRGRTATPRRSPPCASSRPQPLRRRGADPHRARGGPARPAGRRARAARHRRPGQPALRQLRGPAGPGPARGVPRVGGGEPRDAPGRDRRARQQPPGGRRQAGAPQRPRQAAPRRTTGGGAPRSSGGAGASVAQTPAAPPRRPRPATSPAVPSAPALSRLPVPQLPAPSVPTSAPSLPGASVTLDPGGLGRRPRRRRGDDPPRPHRACCPEPRGLSRRPTAAASAGCRASAGWSRGPGRSR